MKLEEYVQLGINKIGEPGGFGTVYEGTLIPSGEPVAVKILEPLSDTGLKPEELSPQEVAAQNLVRDLTLDHPFIVPIRGIFGIEDEQPRVVMPRYQGSVSSFFNERIKATEIVTTDERTLEVGGEDQLAWFMLASEMILNVGVALEYLHDGELVHHDVKEPNILLDYDPREENLWGILNNHKVGLADRGGKDLLYLIAGREAHLKGEVQAGSTSTLDQLTRLNTVTGIAQNRPQFRSVPEEQQHSLIDVFQLAKVARRLLSGFTSSAYSPGIGPGNDAFEDYIEANPLLWPELILCFEKGAPSRPIRTKDIGKKIYTSVTEFYNDFKKQLEMYFFIVPRSELPEAAREMLGVYTKHDAGFVVATPDRFLQLWYASRAESLTYDDVAEVGELYNWIKEGKGKIGSLYKNQNISVPKKGEHPLDTRLMERVEDCVKTIRDGYEKTVEREKISYKAELESADEQQRMGREQFEAATAALRNLEKPVPL